MYMNYMTTMMLTYLRYSVQFIPIPHWSLVFTKEDAAANDFIRGHLLTFSTAKDISDK